MNWKSIVSSIAPALGTALGGPMGGMALKALSSSLLDDEDADENQIEKAIMNASPDTLAKIKQIDAEFDAKMKELDIDLEKIASDDRSDARKREIATQDNAPKILASVIVLGFFSTLATIAFVDIPDGAEQPVSILLGALTAMITQVGNYYFGSSAGSKQKTDLMKSSGR